MVIARTKLMLQDDLLKPRPMFKISYSGPKPTRFYKEIPELLAAAFRVDMGQIQEKNIKWDKGDPTKFKVVWEMDKDLDKFSYYMIELEISGSESKGFGTVAIKLGDGVLRTEYPQDTVWERSLLYEMLRVMWHRTFYSQKREEWIRDGRRMLATFLDELKKVMHEYKEEA